MGVCFVDEVCETFLAFQGEAIQKSPAANPAGRQTDGKKEEKNLNKSSRNLVLLKALLALPCGALLLLPFVRSDAVHAGGPMAELQALGPVPALAAALVFLGLVLAYCLDLRRTLVLAREPRPAPPNSVWLMFLIPYNFIEDFWIVRHVSQVFDEAFAGPRGKRLATSSRWLGYGWCGAQLVSLLPTGFGTAAGGVAVVLWIAHWALVRHGNALLSRSLQA